MDLNKIINESLMDEVRKTILNENKGKDVYHIMCDGEPIDSYETEEIAMRHLDIYKKKHPEKEFIIEKQTYNSHSDMLDSLDDMGENLEIKENKMEKSSVKVKSFAEAILDAKNKGLKKFKIGEESYDVAECWKQLEEEEVCNECGDMEEELTGDQHKLDVDGDGDIQADDLADLRAGKKPEEVKESQHTCNECGSMLNEEGVCNECGTPMNESKKVTLRLTESELVELIGKMVNESVPGLEMLKKTKDGSKKETDDHMKDVEGKMKDYLSFDGNDNPEFPNQVEGGEKIARKNTEEEDEFTADNRGGGLEDLDYDYEPSEKFKERLKKALEGDSTMGNSQDAANVVKSDLGKKIAKKVERKKKAEEAAPMYNKDAQPVKSINESVSEDLKKMLHLSKYNEKTQ